MLSKPLRMGTLNARSIFKVSHPNLQKEFCSFLRNRSLLSLDILCLQEVSCFQQQDHLSDDNILQFNKFLFPNTTSVVSKHTVIVCLNRNFYLDDTAIPMDERCVVASVKDVHHNLVCKVASIYAPAQPADRPAFFSSFCLLPFFENSLDDPWIFLGDFNISLKHTPVSSNNRIVDWFHCLQQTFYNCFSAGLPTYTRPNTDSRSTIDYIFGHSTLSTRLSNGLIHKVPATYTENCY